MSESSQSTWAEKVKLALSALKELNLSKEDISSIRDMIGRAERAQKVEPLTPMVTEQGDVGDDEERDNVHIEMIGNTVSKKTPDVVRAFSDSDVFDEVKEEEQ